MEAPNLTSLHAAGRVSPQPPALCKVQHLGQLHSISPLLSPPQLLLRDFILWARPLLEPGASLTARPCLRHSTQLVFHPSSQLLFLRASRASRAAPPHSRITIHPFSDKAHFWNCPSLSLLNHRPQLSSTKTRSGFLLCPPSKETQGEKSSREVKQK